MNSLRGLLMAVTLVFTIVQESSGTHCWQQKCRECPEEQIDGPGSNVKCETRNLITMTWLDESKFSPNEYTTNDNLEFQCLKLIASDPKIQGDSFDIVRGCVLKSEAKSLCNELKAIEVQKGKTNTQCDFCGEDICNGAMGRGVASILLIFFSIFVRFLFH